MKAKEIQNQNKFIYDLETVLDEIQLLEQFLTLKIKQRDFSVLQPSTPAKVNATQCMLEHCAYTINKYIEE